MRSDIQQMQRAWPWKLVACGALTFAVGCTSAGAEQSEAQASPDAMQSAGTVAPMDALDAELERIRAATAKYQDIDVALADGYIRDPADNCETADMMGRPAEDGVMGIHYVRLDLLGVTGPPNPRLNGTSIHTDFMQPGVLIYEPQADGSLALLAVENVVFIDAWEAAGNTAPPRFMDREYDRMVDDPATDLDEAHGFEPHYDLHVWLYRENPRGIFAQFNPNATCEHHRRGSHGH